MDITFIYGLLDPRTNELRYIGKSNSPNFRLRIHIQRSRINPVTHKDKWIKGLLDKGLSPILEILEEVPIKDWQLAERKWIKECREAGFSLVNISDGGEFNLTIRSEEHRKNISKALVGRKKGPLSEELKKKLSAIHKGKPKNPMSLETKEKLRAINSGKKLSEETKKKIASSLTGKSHPISKDASEKLVRANKNRIWDKDAREKLASVKRGKKHGPLSEETKRKIGDKHKGKVVSEETKKRLSEIRMRATILRDESGRFTKCQP